MDPTQLERLERLYRRRMKGVEVEIIFVTPEMAQELLAKNFRNRRLRETAVLRWVTSLERGEWHVTSDGGIGVDRDGNLQNGQHRLTAIVRTGIGAPFAFFRGLDPAAQDVTDDGSKRSMGDTLFLHGEESSHNLQTALRLLWMWREGIRPLGRQLRVQPTKPQLFRILEKNPGIREALVIGRRTEESGLPRSLGACLYYLFAEQAPLLATVFFSHLETGAGLNVDDPILALRRRLINLRAEGRSNARAKIDIPAAAELTVRAWNFWGEGETVIKLVRRPKAPFPEIEKPSIEPPEDFEPPTENGRYRTRGELESAIAETISGNPGVTAPKIAEHLGVHPTSPYKPLKRLEERGQIVRSGQRWYPKGAVLLEESGRSARRVRLRIEEGQGDAIRPYREGRGHCHNCGGDNAFWVSDAEGAYCPDCGSSDQDE